MGGRGSSSRPCHRGFVSRNDIYALPGGAIEQYEVTDAGRRPRRQFQKSWRSAACGDHLWPERTTCPARDPVSPLVRSDPASSESAPAEIPARDPSGRPVVAAGLDGSGYLAGVCDHAAWLAGAFDASVDLFHVQEPPDAAPRSAPARRSSRVPGPAAILADATQRLQEQGVREISSSVTPGRFGDIAPAFAAKARALVVGRRGLSSARARSGVGLNIMPLLRRTTTTICVAPRLFLPVQRAVILLDDAHRDDQLADRLAVCPWLDGVELSLARPVRTGGRIGLVCGDDHGGGAPPGGRRAPLPCPSDLIVAPRQALQDLTGAVGPLLMELLKGSKAPIIFL